MMEVDDDFGDATRSFNLWLEQHGITVSPKVKLDDLRHRSAGRGVVAVADIEPDELLFSIPRSSILTPETSTIPNHLLQGLEDPWFALILAMIFEFQQGHDSHWAAYLSVLPTTFDTLMFWSDKELDRLKGSAVLSKIGRTKAEESFNTQILPIIASNKAEFNAQSLSATEILALCHRMGSTIMAYAFDIEDGDQHDDDSGSEGSWAEDDEQQEQAIPVGMIPLADMLNANADRNNARLFYEADKVIMKSIKEIEHGEEIFNDYGPLPRADLLRRYGYVTEDYAKYDVVELNRSLLVDVTTSLLKLSPDEVRGRLDYLDTLEIPTDAFDVAHESAEDGPLPLELIMSINILTLSSAEYAKLTDKQSKPSKSLSPDKTAAIQLLRAVLSQRLTRYDRSNELQADGEAHNPRYQMATEVTAGEKAVLKSAIDRLDTMNHDSNKKRNATDTVGRSHKKLRT